VARLSEAPARGSRDTLIEVPAGNRLRSEESTLRAVLDAAAVARPTSSPLLHPLMSQASTHREMARIVIFE
jgi:hypothetical protein